MKFAIPLTDKELTARFGHCQKIALIDVEDNQIKQKGILKPTVHEPAVCSKVLNVLDADIIISSCMANSALSLFDQQGIKVITGAPGGPASCWSEWPVRRNGPRLPDSIRKASG